MSQPAPRFDFRTRLAGRLLAAWIRFVYATSRKRFTNLEGLQAGLDKGPFILVSWHNRNLLNGMAYLAHARPGRALVALASRSRDGGLAAAAMQALGAHCVRGSSSRGGSTALRQLLRALKSGSDIGITPDGPRGPLYRVQPGAIAAARLSGAPIIPLCWQARRRRILGSWDSTIVPWPFNDLHIAFGEPLRVPRDADAAQMESCRRALEDELMRLAALVDAGFPASHRPGS